MEAAISKIDAFWFRKEKKDDFVLDRLKLWFLLLLSE